MSLAVGGDDDIDLYLRIVRWAAELEATFDPGEDVNAVPQLTSDAVNRYLATAGERSAETHDRLRHDRVDVSGKITLRYQGQLSSIGIGRTHARTHVLVLVQDLNVRIVNAATGDLLRELVLDPTVRYQPTRRPPGPTPKTINP
jgi:hypothetical protein